MVKLPLLLLTSMDGAILSETSNLPLSASILLVYREFNVKEDSLSKEALLLASSSLHFMEFTEGECIGMGTFHLY